MRILVAGANGFLGRAAVRGLSRAGHEVRGLIRQESQSREIRQLGAEPVLGDLTSDAAQLRSAMEGCDQVIHLAQSSDGELEGLRRVRVDGCRALVSAAAETQVSRIVVGSGYWVYRSNPGVITEESELDPRSISLVNYETELVAREAMTRGLLETVVVRPGMVYGNGSWLKEMIEELRSGQYRYVADGTNHLSPVDIDDAGEAFRRIVERGRPGETYLVVDDSPVTTRAFAEFVADRVGAPKPSGLSPAEAAQEWGIDLAILNGADRRGSNAKLRQLGWSPRFPTYRDGLPRVLSEMPGT